MGPADPTKPGSPQGIFPSTANELSHEPHVSTASIGNATDTNTDTNTKDVYVYNVYKEENKLEALVHSRVPLEIKTWLSALSSQTQESESTIIRKLLIAAYQGSSAPNSYQAPIIILNYNTAKAESKPVVNIGEYVALKQLNDLLADSRKLNARADRERCSGQVVTFTRERAKALEEGLLKALKSLKSLPPEKLQEVEAALQILRGIREGRQ